MPTPNNATPTQPAASAWESYLKQAIKEREDANSARGRAARHAGEAAKAQKKVHDAETKLHAEEQPEARKAEENRRATEKKATIERERADSRRESAHRKEVATLRAQIDDQARLLATAPWERTLETRCCSWHPAPKIKTVSGSTAPMRSRGWRSAMGIQPFAFELCSDLAKPRCAELAPVWELVASIPTPRCDHR
jgi:hypothetical protein